MGVFLGFTFAGSALGQEFLGVFSVIVGYYFGRNVTR